MSVNQYNAIQFNHPDFDWDKTSPGFSCTHDGKMSLVSGAMAIRQSILFLLSTRPGERIRRPEYGCELYRLTFMPNDATTHGLAIHYVTQAVEQWEPRVIITNIDANSNNMDASKMDINLNYEIRSLEINDELTLTLTLM